jgi:hypothetical protein
MKFSKWVFRIAGVYGLAVLVPQYFLEERIGIDTPPAITHPEFYYGFLGVAVAWQIAFFVIAGDPIRYRPMMLVGVLEKLSFGIACIVLFTQQRLAAQMFAAGMVDLALGALFCLAWMKTGKDART